MVLKVRQKSFIVPLLLYWPLIFVLTHAPLPQGLPIILPSDKIIHYLAYLVLAFLLWFAVNPGQKVRWRKAPVWGVLITIAFYGAIDEWLQGYVHRNPDIGDFLANLAGGLTSLAVLTVIPFWPASLALTGAAIFVTRNILQANWFDLLPVTCGVGSFVAYGFFSLLWIRNMSDLILVKAPQVRWVVGTIALPVGLLLGVEIFSAMAGRGFRLWVFAVSAGGIMATVGAFYLFSLFRQNRRAKLPAREV
jgi:hypothetical protein